jgi:hypothetical protein
MSTCSRCGCTKPCGCDCYSPEESTCIRCGCTKPCGCDYYSDRQDREEIEM